MELDPASIVKLLGTQDYPEALAKLYRIIGSLEIMMLKYTEYEILSFLKYDDSFTNLMKRSTLKDDSSRIHNLGIGINVQRFQVALTNLDRLENLFTIASRVVSKKTAPIKVSQGMIGAPLKPLPLSGLQTPSKFKSLEDFENFLKNTKNCQLNQNNIKNILQNINYLKKKAITYKKQYKQAQDEYTQQQKKLETVSQQSAADKQENENEKEEDPTNKPKDLGSHNKKRAALQTDAILSYQKKNMDLKSKIAILKKDLQLWKDNYSEFKEEVRSKGDVTTRSVSNREYFLRMLDDYKEAYMDRINMLTEKNTTDTQELENIVEENNLMKQEITSKTDAIKALEVDIKKM